jgi:uncharacterized caspase-like protein
MANIMRKLGFKVFDVIDGDKASMERAIDQMKDQLKGKQAVAMLYYAGHGLQLDWHNYMVPVDVKLNSSADVPKQTIDIERVITTFKNSSTRMNIIVLDACRDNPFADKASGKGLAQLDAPPGTYLAFATAPGNVAEDGDESSGNGLFTQYLIKELQKPATIENVFKRVRLQVRQKSQGRQIPWDSSSLEDDFAFNDGAKHTFNPEDLIREAKEAKEKEERLKAEAEAAKQRELKIAQDREAERLRLIEAKKIQEQQAREKAEAESRERERQLALAAEAERKKAQEAALALERAKAAEAERLKAIEEAKVQAELDAKLRKESADKQFEIQKADWDKIKDSKNETDFYEFLKKYPNGLISELANFTLNQLSKSQITIQPDRSGIVQTANPSRLLLGDSFKVIVKNGFDDQEVRSGSFSVDKIENGRVYVNLGKKSEKVTSLNGDTYQSNNATGRHSFDPPLGTFPSTDFFIGKKWTSRSIETFENGKSMWREDKFLVSSFESVNINGEVIPVYKVVDEATREDQTKIKIFFWLHPNWGSPLRSETILINKKGVTYLWEKTEATYISRKL